MPGNEFGGRIHNFFEQDSLSRDQHQSQVVDGSWSTALVGNQRQIDPSLIANLKSFSTQQSADPQRGQPQQQGLNFTQQPIRPEYSRRLLQEHQQPTNGYMKGNLVSHAFPNEANVLGVDAESSRDRLSSARGFTSDLHKLPMRFEMGESPVNYDIFGGQHQQQLNSQLPGMFQPLPTQQMNFNDMQLLKQQAMVKQMHDYQMQQQLLKQQLEARQLNSFNSNGSHSSDNQPHHLINGIPLQDASSNFWQPDLMTGNTNWMHRGISPVVQGSCSGLMITHENGQADLLAQQFEPSFHSMPIGGGNAPQSAFSSVQINSLDAQYGSAKTSSSLTNQPTSFLNQGDVHDSQLFPTSTYLEKQLFSHTSIPGSNSRPNFESVQQDDSRERNSSVPEKFCQMEGSGLSEKSFMKVPENINALQKSTTLDPTEEKILFGSDDNLWEAFGNSTDMGSTGNLMSNSSGLFEACPSLQSGRWSALMQSALAETNSDDAGVHEWANTNTGPDVKSHSVKASNTLSEGFHSDPTTTAVQHVQAKTNKVSNHGLLEKPMDQQSQMSGNMFRSSSGFDWQSNMCSIGKNEAASNLNVLAPMEQKNHLTQNLQMQRARYGAGNDSSASRDLQENIQQHLDYKSVEKVIPQMSFRDSSQILESDLDNNSVRKASNIANNVMVESNEMGNSEKEQASDSFLSKFLPESFTGFKETTQVSARDFTMVPGGKETQSPSRSDGLLSDGLNHKESVNYMLRSGQVVSHSALASADRHQESSRYSQFVTSKNQLVQPVNDTGIFSPMKISEQYSNVGHSVDGLHSVLSSKQLSMQQMSGSTPGAETLSSDSLPLDATEKLLKVDEPKKRKAPTSWNKVVQGPQKLKTLGEAEVEWARATNQFSEKVNFETSLEDFPPIKSKRRLIYTTQLIQQLFCPPPPRVISLVASSNYEFVAYTAARAALGDACSSISSDRSESFSNNSNQLSERSIDQYDSKAAEDFKSRLRKLETDFARLENAATITELRIEVQDLERFAVINRFASFHQSPSSMSSSVRLNPQRYVSIAPMPRNIPDRVQCLSF